MKTILITLAFLAIVALAFTPIIKTQVDAIFKQVGAHVVASITAPSVLRGPMRTQGGFVTLLRPYMGYISGQIVELPKSTEDTLIAAGQATTSAGPPTTGAFTTLAPGGAAAIAAGQSSIVITNALVTAQSLIYAVISQAAADGTLTSIQRVLPAAGSFTIYGNANATATVTVDWAILTPFGNLSNPI